MIESFSKPVTDVPFPSVTLCNEQGLDTGEYVRNVFNNLAFAEDEGNNKGRYLYMTSALRGEGKCPHIADKHN